jgi:hypothetical protein
MASASPPGLRGASRVPVDRGTDVGVPPEITGTFERLLAFGLFFFDAPDAYTILALWIGAKLASNWPRRSIGQG